MFTRRFLAMIAIATFCLSVTAQTPIELPKTRGTYEWRPDYCDYCDSFYEQGKLYETLNGRPRILVGVALMDLGNRMRVDLFVVNRNPDRIDIVPSQIALLHSPTPDKNGRTTWKESRQQSPEEIARSFARQAQWRGALAGLAAATQRDETRIDQRGQADIQLRDNRGNVVTGGVRSTSQTTISEPSIEARRQANSIAIRERENALDAIDYLNRVALRANTLESGQNIAGSVFFERPKNRKDMAVRLSIDRISTDYIFRFSGK